MGNSVFIATSLDGYIADVNNGIDWLPAPDENLDFGFNAFMDRIDAIVMGRNTFEMVLSFGIAWPYTKPVFVLSSSLEAIPEDLAGKVSLINDEPSIVAEELNGKGYKNLYIDGGVTIQNFLKEELIDEMTITTIPVLLGGGKSLFGELEKMQNFICKDSFVINGIVQNHFVKS